MKSDEEIKKLAEDKFPYNPYDEQFFPGTRQSKIHGFILGYRLAQMEFKTTDIQQNSDENPKDNPE